MAEQEVHEIIQAKKYMNSAELMQVKQPVQAVREQNPAASIRKTEAEGSFLLS